MTGNIKKHPYLHPYDQCTLDELAKKYNTDKDSDRGGYVYHYETHFSPLKNKSIRILELGVREGASLRMWRDYFRNAVEVHGIDIDQRAEELNNEDGLQVTIGNLDDENFLYEFIEKTPKFDIVIDDASHKINDQLISFRNLHKLVSKGGLYIIEDIEDIDSTRLLFEELHRSCKIYDMREQKNRFDNVMVVYEF